MLAYVPLCQSLLRITALAFSFSRNLLQEEIEITYQYCYEGFESFSLKPALKQAKIA